MTASTGISRFIACVIGCSASNVKKPMMRPCASITGCISRADGTRIGLEFQTLEADALLDHAHEARIDFAAGSEQRAKFGDRVAQASRWSKARVLSSLRRASA